MVCSCSYNIPVAKALLTIQDSYHPHDSTQHNPDSHTLTSKSNEAGSLLHKALVDAKYNFVL